MNKYRVIEGSKVPGTNKTFSFGYTYEAANAQDAVSMHRVEQRKALVGMSLQPLPIFRVYLLTEMNDWE